MQDVAQRSIPDLIKSAEVIRQRLGSLRRDLENVRTNLCGGSCAPPDGVKAAPVAVPNGQIMALDMELEASLALLNLIEGETMTLNGATVDRGPNQLGAGMAAQRAR